MRRGQPTCKTLGIRRGWGERCIKVHAKGNERAMMEKRKDDSYEAKSQSYQNGCKKKDTGKRPPGSKIHRETGMEAGQVLDDQKNESTGK